MTCKYCNGYTPEEYYKIAIQLPEYQNKIFTVFGKTPIDIIKALELYDKMIVAKIIEK